MKMFTRMSARRKIFYGTTLAFVATLLLLPATGWLARLQLMPWTFAPIVAQVYSSGGNVEPSKSSDFDIRYGAALFASGNKVVQNLEVLNRDTPSNPQVLAALLRMLSCESMPHRPEEALLEPSSRQKDTNRETYPYKPMRNAARIIAFAEQGEALEPDNGFFPTMAALGYFAQKNDDAAVAAWIRAGAAPRWDDYSFREVDAKWKLLQAKHGGEVGAIARMSSMAAILFPHYAGIRSSARMASAMAMQAELAGNAEAGFGIRRASRQIGEGMQQQRGSFIGGLVGSAVASIAQSRAGGAEVVENPYPSTDKERVEQWIKAKQNKYATYLRSIGHPEEATAFLATMERTVALKKIWKNGSPQTYMGFDAKTYQLMLGWAGNILLIAGALFALGFAGVFALVYKFSPRLQRNEPLQKSARWGVWMGLLTPVFVLATVANAESTLLTPGDIPIAIIGVGILTIVITPFVLRLTAREVGHGVGVVLATIAALGVIGGLIVAVGVLFGGFASSFGLMRGDAYNENGDMARSVWLSLVPVIFGTMMALLPLLMLALFALFSRMLKIPVAAGVTRGTRSIAVPLACLLLLAWGASVFNTLRHENAAIAEMKRITEIGELRTVAEVSGQPYPL